MNIVIPAYILSTSNIELILDQIYVTVESYYRFNDPNDTFIIYTNNVEVKKGIKLFNTIYEKSVRVEIINFEKLWENIGLNINVNRTRRAFIISKLLMPFILEEDYLLMDWDILTTGIYAPEIIKSNKLRFFNPKNYDGVSLRIFSVWKGLKPESKTAGNNRWINSGLAYFPKNLTKQMILEYWEKYDSINEQKYKNIFLFDIIGDELIYNLMLLDENKNIEEYREHNINVVLKNFYYNFESITSMYNFGSTPPYILNVHFSSGLIKPFDVIINDKDDLSCTTRLEKYGIEKESLKWVFDISTHIYGSYNYNSLIFSLIWQYTRYNIREKMGLTKENISSRYLNFFNRYIIGKQ
jgi:hypothetical protein